MRDADLTRVPVVTDACEQRQQDAGEQFRRTQQQRRPAEFRLQGHAVERLDSQHQRVDVDAAGGRDPRPCQRFSPSRCFGETPQVLVGQMGDAADGVAERHDLAQQAQALDVAVGVEPAAIVTHRVDGVVPPFPRAQGVDAKAGETGHGANGVEGRAGRPGCGRIWSLGHRTTV